VHRGRLGQCWASVREGYLRHLELAIVAIGARGALSVLLSVLSLFVLANHTRAPDQPRARVGVGVFVFVALGLGFGFDPLDREEITNVDWASVKEM